MFRSLQILVLLFAVPLFAYAQAESWKEKVQRGHDLQMTHHYNEARQAFTTALSMAESHGKETHECAVVLSHLATLEQDTGNLLDAERHYVRALGIIDKSAEATDTEIATVVMSLIVVYLDTGQVAKAERYAERGVILSERPGLDTSDAATLVYLSGAVHQARHDPAQAGKQYRRAVEMKEATGRTSDDTMVHILNNLGLLGLDEGNLDKAEASFQRAFSIAQGLHGPSDAAVIKPALNLASVHWMRGQLKVANGEMQHVAAIAEAALPSEHPLLGQVLMNCARIARDLHDKRAAREYAERGQAILRQNPGQALLNSTVDLSALGTRRQ